MSHSPPFGRFARYLAIVFGPGLIGWAISPGPAGWAIGLGVGIVVAGVVWRLAIAFEAMGNVIDEPPPVRVSLDRDDFRRLVRGQVIGRPGGIRIALQDIGFPVMIQEVAHAAAGIEEGSHVP